MAEETKKGEPKAGEASIDEVKGIAALAYLIFFLPLITHPTNTYTKYHANQGLNLFLLAVAINVIGTIIPILGWFIILPLGNIAVLILFIIGVLHAINGEKKPLPVIGGYELLK